MNDKRAEELLESWINGNRTWVWEQLLAMKKKEAIVTAIRIFDNLGKNGAEDFARFLDR